MSGDESAVQAARLNILKKTFSRVTERREKRVITNLVNDYKNRELSPEKAYAAIIVIAELRWAGSDIDTKDLQ